MRPLNEIIKPERASPKKTVGSETEKGGDSDEVY